ncbi:MAG: hypothetical protein ACT4OY_02015 [Alphaproteobacteria bacterium]
MNKIEPLALSGDAANHFIQRLSHEWLNPANQKAVVEILQQESGHTRKQISLMLEFSIAQEICARLEAVLAEKNGLTNQDIYTAAKQTCLEAAAAIPWAKGRYKIIPNYIPPVGPGDFYKAAFSSRFKNPEEKSLFENFAKKLFVMRFEIIG